MLECIISAHSHRVEGTARITSCCFACRAITELMPPDARREGDKLVINSVVIALVTTIIVGIMLLLIISAVEFFSYIRSVYLLMKRIDQDPWNILDVSWALDMTPTQVKILYTKFCEVRNSWRSLIHSTK